MPAAPPPDVAPTRADPVVAALSEVVGGPLGTRAGHHPWWSPGRVVLATTTIVLAIGMATKKPCLSSSWGGETEPYAQLCWTDLAGVSASHTAAPWPAARLTRLSEWVASPLPGDATVATVAVLALVLAGLALMAAMLLARTDPMRPWAAAGWAAAPLLAVHWLSWDLVAAAGLAIVIWAWAARDRGVPALLAMWVGGFLVVAFAYPVVTTSSPDTGSMWLVVEQAAGSLPGRSIRLAVTAVAVALAAAAALRVALRSRDADIAALCRTALVPAAVLLVLAPSAPPEAALLLLPLAAVAAIGWRDLLVWQACELVSWAITGWWLAGLLAPSDGGDARAYWVAVLVRVVGLVWLAVAALRTRAT